MGKGEDKSEESDEETNSAEETTEEAPKIEEEDSKKDTEELRKVIKVDSNKENKEEKPKEEPSPEESNPEPTPRDSLEQKRAILQSIKDFDFQIKKNQEGITAINQKMGSVSKDLDDLVSLYEIVSEQMNPFVGLSKVTKKRIDALENFTKEIEDLKDRTGELESFAERSGVKIKNLGEIKRKKAKTIDTDGILGDEGEETEESENIEGDKETEKLEETGEIQQEAKTETVEQESETAQQIETQEEIEQPDMPQELQTQFTDDEYQITEQQTYQSDFEYNSWESLSDDDLDMIIERTLGGSSPERKIDMIIDEFIESLKG